MDSLKNLFILAVLGAVAYGGYTSVTKDSASAPPPEVAEGWAGALNVQVPGSGSVAPPFEPSLHATGVAPAASPTLEPAPPAVASSFPAGAPWTGDSGPSQSAADSALSPANPATDLSQASGPPAVSPPAHPPAEPQPNPDEVRSEFTAFMETARAKLQESQLDEVHRVLSSWYGDPRLTAAEAAQLTDLLDQIAGTALYSRAPNEFAQAYTVKPGDTLESIAAAHDVPWQLLAKINGISDPQSLQPGQQLKVVPGPFHAVVELAKYEMTLMVQDHYAGRFPIGIGQDQPDLEGTYVVREKVVNPTYYGRDGEIDADDPRNPLGERWISLGDNQVGIHGTNDPQNVGQTRPKGSVCLGERDIEDVFDILSVGSRVVIRR